MELPAAELLSKYAEIAIRVGVNLAPGDRLLIHSSTEAIDFTRILVERAYGAGAVNVDVFWSDEAVSRARFTHGPAAAAESISTASRARLAAFEAGDLMLYVDARDPGALAGLDASRIAAHEKVNREALMPLMAAQGRLETNWSVVAAPSAAWAAKVFPDQPIPEAIESLWAAIFRACRVDTDDPVAAWRHHVASLNARADHLTGREYAALRYHAPGTDLRLGLPENAVWKGGSGGSPFVPNIPTEEVFAAPHRVRGEGVVAATKPLSLFGQLVEGFSFEVSEGRIVAAQASRGQEVLDQLLAVDEGSARFGEVAMVPMSSAVAAERLIWNNTLYDENDGCHIAVGRAYPISIDGGADMSPDELTAAGLNVSSTHVDFVVGSDQLDVFGIRDGGGEEAIITSGEWGFAL